MPVSTTVLDRRIAKLKKKIQTLTSDLNSLQEELRILERERGKLDGLAELVRRGPRKQ